MEEGLTMILKNVSIDIGNDPSLLGRDLKFGVIWVFKEGERRWGAKRLILDWCCCWIKTWHVSNDSIRHGIVKYTSLEPAGILKKIFLPLLKWGASCYHLITRKKISKTWFWCDNKIAGIFSRFCFSTRTHYIHQSMNWRKSFYHCFNDPTLWRIPFP